MSKTLKCKKCGEPCKHIELLGAFCLSCKDKIIEELIGLPEEKNEVMKCKQCDRQYMPDIDNNGLLINICKTCYRKNYCKSKLYLKSIQSEFCPHGLHNSDRKCVQYEDNKEIFVKKQIECILHRECLSNEFLLFEYINFEYFLIKKVDTYLQKAKYRNKGRRWSEIYIDLYDSYPLSPHPDIFISYNNLKVYFMEESNTEFTDFKKEIRRYKKEMRAHVPLRQIEYGIK